MVWEPVSKGAVPRLRKALRVLTYPSLIHAHSYNVKVFFFRRLHGELIHAPHAPPVFCCPFLCASAGAALLLSGCSSATQELEKAFDSRVNIEPVVGSIWRISAERPKVESSARIADFVYERAKAFCTDKGMGMMPLKGSSSAASADGQPAKAWLEFRCASPEKVEREYKGITLHFDELLGDDGKKKKN